MSDVLLLVAPADLRAELDADEFDEVPPLRGAHELLTAAQPVVSLVLDGLDSGADVVTILVARESIANLVQGVQRWAGRKAAAGQQRKVSIQVIVRRADGESRLTLEARGSNGALDAASLGGALQDALEDSA